MTEPTLGLIMIIKDEAANLPRSLLPVARCFDEIVVVDSGSTDESRQICRDAGARVYDFTWCDDFAAARNHSIAQANADWLLWLDGDNATEPRMIDNLRRTLPRTGPGVIWGLEQVIPSGEKLWQKRCFARRPDVRFQGRVHEQLIHPPDWPLLTSAMIIRHWGYDDPTTVRRKGQYYAGLLQKNLAEDPDDFYSHFQIARCYHNLRRTELAERHLMALVGNEQAPRLNFGLWVSGHMMLARLLELGGRANEALALLDGFLSAHGPSSLILYQKGRLLYGAGLWAQAAKALGEAIDLGLNAPFIDNDPDKTTGLAHFYLGRCLAKLDQIDSAARHLQKAAALDPANQAAPLELARLLMDTGHRGDATRVLNHILARRPGDRSALRLLKQCGVAA